MTDTELILRARLEETERRLAVAEADLRALARLAVAEARLRVVTEAGWRVARSLDAARGHGFHGGTDELTEWAEAAKEARDDL